MYEIGKFTHIRDMRREKNCEYLKPIDERETAVGRFEKREERNARQTKR